MDIQLRCTCWQSCPGDGRLGCQLVFTMLLEVSEELGKELLGSSKLVSERATPDQVIDEGFAKGVHRLVARAWEDLLDRLPKAEGAVANRESTDNRLWTFAKWICDCAEWELDGARSWRLKSFICNHDHSNGLAPPGYGTKRPSCIFHIDEKLYR